MSTVPVPSKILVIKLADLGDVLTATPALRALRRTFPQARIDLLLTHHTQTVMQHSRLVNGLIPSDNFRFFSPKAMLKPGLLVEAMRVLRRIRRGNYDTVLVLHHLTTAAGAAKYATIAKVSGARTIAGLDPGGRRGRFLTHAVPDLGFGARHEIDYWLAVTRLLGAETDDCRMGLSFSEADSAWVDLMLTMMNVHVTVDDKPATASSRPPLVVIHPGSGGFSLARRWSPANFAAVADSLAERGAQIVLVGTAADGTEAVKTAMTTTPIDLTGQTSLHQLAALLARADLFIGGDSGVTHVAAASDLPLIAIFGPTNAAAWGPVGSHQRVLQADIPCGPCAYVEHQVGLRAGCPARTCLKLIAPAQVLAVAEDLLALGPAPAAEIELTVTADQHTTGIPRLESDPKPDLGVSILGVRVDAVTFDQTLALIQSFITAGGPHQVATVNPEFVVAAQQDAVFRRIINRAALALPDGIGLLRAARWLNQPPLPERVAGVDIVEALSALSAQHGYRLFFLGAMPGVADKAVAVLRGRYPNLVCVGVYPGSPGAEDEDAIVAMIQEARPDILFVAYGAPNQDKWIARNMQRLPASVLIGVGGAFDFISGTTRRAPLWLQRAGLEWLHRLIRQPSRWRRIWNAVPGFMWLVYREKRGRLHRRQ